MMKDRTDEAWDMIGTSEHGQIICAVIDDFDFRQICCWGHQI